MAPGKPYLTNHTNTMQHIISLKADCSSAQDLCAACESAAKNIATAMPLEHKNALVISFLSHYFFLHTLREANPDIASSDVEAAFEAFSSILSSSGVDLTIQKY